MSSLLNFTIDTVFSIVSTAIKFILYPIDSIIVSVLPDLGSSTSAIVDFLNLCFKTIGWCIDALGIPSSLITLVISYYVFKYTLSFGVLNFKLIIRWVKNFI